MWSKVVVFLALVSVALAAVAIAPLEPKPEKFEKIPGCYLKDLDQVIPFGQKAASKSSCFEYYCGQEYVQHLSCGAVAVPPSCKTESDTSKPYPECCPKLKC